MKNIKIIIVLSIALFISCEKVVNIDVPSVEPKLIIDASFEVYFDEIPITSNSTVKLRLSADYFENTIPTVTNATVFLTNLSDNSIINFSDANADGNYEPVNSFIPLDTIEYELTVTYNNQTYKGKTRKVKSTPIINVEQGVKTLFSGKEIEIKVKFKDDENENNNYFFDFSNRNFSVLEDRFFNGQEYEVPNFYQEGEIEVPTTVSIKMSGINKQYFTYLRILLRQSGINGGGGPFQSVPSSLLGNMINTTNEANFPLGYFHISETDNFIIDLVNKN